VIRMGWKAAATSSPVLIWGETGVGKEIVASVIHQTSTRNDKPFVVINCASIPDELLEAELFGYEEGSFTGAKRSGRKGILEEAHEGTLFLDEIGELPLKMQSKLLRFLQEGTFKRIGSNKTQSVDVRILSATNLTVDQLLSSKHFRQDLFYRIAVVPIFVPPLRERKEDIFPLINYFIKKFNLKYTTEIKLPVRQINRLYNYEWPGNVRELKNVIERIAILYASQELSEEDLESILNINPNEDNKEVPAFERPVTALPSSLKKATERFEENLIRQAYKETGSIVKAAKALGINPSTIHRKLSSGVIKLD
ncbi:MAG: sigma-54 interaction domain-containing protein, partial [Smithella sp.]